jgi:hypothetical protein
MTKSTLIMTAAGTSGKSMHKASDTPTQMVVDAPSADEQKQQAMGRILS